MGRLWAGLVSGVWIVLLLVFPLYQMSRNNVERGLLGEKGSYKTPLTAGYGSLSSGIRGVEWNKTYGGPGYDWAYSLQETSDGGFIVAGDTLSFGAGSFDAWLIKTDSDGNMEWNKTYGGEDVDDTHSAIQTSDGGYAIGGWNSMFSLIKTDINGNVQWNKTYGGDFESVIQTGDGGYVLVGTIFHYPTTFADFWLVKVDSNGNMQWNNTFGGADSDYAKCGIQTDDGGYAIAGYTNSYGAGEADVWLVKTNANGDLQWSRTYGDSWFDSAHSVIQTNDGGYALAGWTESDPGYWLVKTDSGGNVEWSRTYGGDWTAAESVIQTDDGGYALVGDNFRFIKTDSAGNLKWDQTFGGGPARSILQTDDGGFVIAGSTGYYDSGDSDFWLIKYNPYRVHNINTGLSYIFIQDAIDAAETLEGHTIRVDEDTYYEHVVMNKNNLTLVGENPSTTVIDGDGTGNVITITANNVTIVNFSVQHSGSQGNDSGIFVETVSNCSTLLRNAVTNNNYGISLIGSNNILRNNSMIGNRYNFRAIGIQDVDTSNIVDGKPIYYLVSRQNMQVPSDAGYVALINSYNITVRGLELKNNEQGVELYNTTNSRIANNNVTKNRFGVYLDYLSDNNTVSENNITDNRYGVGVATLGKAVVEQNEISGNSESGILIVGESDVLIKENIIKLNSDGISTDNSAIHSGIVVVGNIIIENGNGVSLGSDANGYCSLHDITFSSNNVSSNGWSGITLWTRSGYSGYSDLYNITFSSNVVLANFYHGIELTSFGVGDGAWPMGPGYSYLHDVVFSSNNISANGYDGIFLRSEGRGYYDNGYSYLCNITFSSNTLIGNGEYGVMLQSASSDFHGGSNHDKLYNIMFSSNTVLANVEDGIHLYCYGNAESHLYNVTLSSNIISSNGENGLMVEARDHYAEFDLVISNNTVSSNNQKGIWIDGDINANLTHNSISYNTHGVFYSTSKNNSATYNDIYCNSYGMNVASSATVNATYNYWGASSGPYHELLNPNGTGNSVNGDGTDLEFIPFLSGPIGPIVDLAAPTTVHDYYGLWHTSDFTIILTAIDDLSGVADVYYLINDGPIQNVTANGQPLITTEGANNKLEYWSVDKAGNEESHHILTGIKLDKTAPTGSIVINNDDAYTTSSSVTLTLTADDATSGVYQIRFSSDGVWDTELWEDFSITKTWTLTSGDGTKTVYYQIKDNAGLISETYTDTIVLDTTIPNIETPTREPADDIQPDQPVKVSVNVTDATSQVKNVTLSYTINDGEMWTDLPMNHTTSNLYEATIPSQQADTTVRFSIIAYDYAGNNATLDGTQPYCVYQVIPEFPSSLILPIFMIITLLAATAYKRKHLPL